MEQRRLLRYAGACLLLSCACTFSGCKDADYDFDNIDMLIGVGGEKLDLPGNNSTHELTLDDFLELNDNNFINIATNGDYTIDISDANWHSTNPSIDQIVFNDPATEGGSIPLNLPLSAAPKLRRAAEQYKLASFNYQGISVPQEVKDLEYIGCNAEITISLTMPGIVKQISNLTIGLPECIDVKSATVTAGTVRVLQDHTLSIDNVRNGTLRLAVEGFFVGDEQTPNGIAVYNEEAHTLDVAGTFTASATINRADIDLATLPSGNLGYLAGAISLSSITITKAVGYFAPAFNFDQLGTVNLNNIPDFLQGNDVKLDMYNPQIFILFNNDLPLGGLVSGRLIAYDANRRQMAAVDVPEFRVEPDECVVCISKRPTTFGGDTLNVVVPNLSDIIERVPHTIEFTDIRAEGDSHDRATLELGYTYAVRTQYHVQCPLQFDDDAAIVYRDSTDGWNSTMKDLSFVERKPGDPTSIDGYVTMEADVASKLPVYLVVKPTAMDVNGKSISDSQMTVSVDKTVAASPDGITPKTTHLVITLKPHTNEALHKLDGIKFEISMNAADSDGQNPIAGKTINAYSQTIHVTNVSASTHGKVVVDAN